ncbi:MAG: SDR family oxidoreductase [Halobacteriales archaeon]|nr:SDR family oxidoreductase [Halobacteriales archaeon]
MRSAFRPDLLKDKVCLVTGGGTGLGFAMADAFAAHGAHVAIASRKEEHLKPAAEQLEKHGQKVLWRTLDVRQPDQVQALMDGVRDELGGLDVLVNNAAGNFLVGVEELSPNGWRAVLGIVLDGTFYCSKAAFPMLEERKGSIINIVATYAWTAAPATAHSGAAKAGVLNLTGTCAVEWGPRGVRCNAIAPGPIDTPGASGQLFPTPELRERVAKMVPMERFGEQDDIGQAALYLASAPYVTGACLVVDGGLSMGSTRFLHGPE